jgi:hypothetical protein
MTRTHSLFAAALLSSVLAAPAWSASSATSSASDSASTSVGSSSDSITTSSKSSSPDNKVAEGDYKVMAVAAAPGRPGMVRMTLQAKAAAGADGEVFLVVPQAVARQSGLGQGDVVTARNRPYGVEFSDAGNRKAFFLALHDDWLRDLHSRPL